MNITEIKTELNIGVLNLNTATNDKGEPLDKDGKPNLWMRHWDNDNRVQVSIHKETVAAIQAGTATTLGIQTESRTGSKGEYTSKRIVMFTPAELTL
jgi:hypothetical protein